MTMTSAGRTAVLCGMAVLLAACSQEPSATDINKALNRAIREEQAQLKGLAAGLIGGDNPFGDLLAIEVTDLEKIGCKESGDKAYVCDVRYTVKGGHFGNSGRSMAMPVRILNASDGWIASTR
ncbi:hypothetical protein PZ897_14305 [Hoeflea sp. YIM 152468]|uniref:hypothetical protein n=1 Tax=Hoeflea sp. YIM 152468 TaxID=3031759 RepID=UPI0023DA07C9|nr:hypothetical protein [Hoeflea sp. YIM 152468]MDF1609355.1 hypothetical protein [Hoeflea sp. YIM 152468]